MNLHSGVDINLLDKNRNTPLHYASKFGNIDVCRYLVALNCLTGSRNTSGQSPYEVAESHLVRQYLLPLQFQEEARHPDAIAQQAQPQDPFALGGRSQVPTNVAPPPVFSPPNTPSAGGGNLSANSPQVNCYGQQQGYSAHSRYVAYPGMEGNSLQQQQPSNSLSTASGQQSAAPLPSAGRFNHPTASSSQTIQPGERQWLDVHYSFFWMSAHVHSRVFLFTCF